jgi:para-aminobenzoate synthetase component I
MTLAAFKDQMNKWGRDRVPFLFMVDFEMERPQAWPLRAIGPAQMLFNFNGVGNDVAPSTSSTLSSPLRLQVQPVTFLDFKKKFDQVVHYLKRGDSFLTNLTFRSSIENAIDLQALFYRATAKYKLWLRSQFVFYSPESFIQIADGTIRTFPMKGTIDASVKDASEKILSDPKELAEHITIVDLLRNDLCRVATDVEVVRFRYVDEIKTTARTILQVSSEIRGQLPHDYSSRLGDIVMELLPAGSISGAPKQRTVEIIRDTEQTERGYYTGVAGVFDGASLDSCVMIRFVEQQGDNFFYRSGGGITAQSDAELEYAEMLNKIYVPTV